MCMLVLFWSVLSLNIALKFLFYALLKRLVLIALLQLFLHTLSQFMQTIVKVWVPLISLQKCLPNKYLMLNRWIIRLRTH